MVRLTEVVPGLMEAQPIVSWEGVEWRRSAEQKARTANPFRGLM